MNKTVQQHIEDDKSFVIVSASIPENTARENASDFIDLVGVADEYNHKYIELRKGYTETLADGSKIEFTTDALLIYEIDRAEALLFGHVFNQRSIIYKDTETISHILTNNDFVGKIDIEFRFDDDDGNNTFSIGDIFNSYVVSVKKGLKRG